VFFALAAEGQVLAPQKGHASGGGENRGTEENLKSTIIKAEKHL
jgi:hypothetical protein